MDVIKHSPDPWGLAPIANAWFYVGATTVFWLGLNTSVIMTNTLEKIVLIFISNRSEDLAQILNSNRSVNTLGEIKIHYIEILKALQTKKIPGDLINYILKYLNVEKEIADEHFKSSKNQISILIDPARIEKIRKNLVQECKVIVNERQEFVKPITLEYLAKALSEKNRAARVYTLTGFTESLEMLSHKNIRNQKNTQRP